MTLSLLFWLAAPPDRILKHLVGGVSGLRGRAKVLHTLSLMCLVWNPNCDSVYNRKEGRFKIFYVSNDEVILLNHEESDVINKHPPDVL